MIIKKLILSGYKRMFLNNIEKIEYTPEMPIQILLGGNGSGKSSLLRELTPLPADLKKDYKEDGYKQIEITNNNKEYLITSGVVGKGKHSFRVNGEELNQAGIRKIQLQLVEEHFGLTPQIHEILLGNVLFTNMSVNDRKKWLSMISNIDYSYSINVFNKLKSRHRDILGAIKITQNKQLQEDIRLLSTDDRVKLKEDVKALKMMLTHILNIKNNNIEKLPEIDIVTLNKTYISKAKNILKELEALENKDLNHLETIVFKTEANIKALEEKINSLNKQIIEIKKISTTGVTNTELIELTKQRDEIKKKIVELEQINTYGFDLREIQSIANNFNYLYSEFISMLSNLTDYEDIYYSTDEEEKLTLKVNKLKENVDGLHNLLIKLKNDKLHMEEHLKQDKVTCDKCGNSWYLNYNKQDHINIVRKIEEVSTKYELLKKQYEEEIVILNRLLEKKSVIKSLRLYISNNKSLLNVFKVIINGLDIQKDVSQIISNANEVNLVLNRLKDYNRYLDKYNELNNKLTIINSNNELKKQYSEKSLDALENDLSKAIHEKYSLENKLIKYKKQLNSLQELQTVYKKLVSISKYHSKELKISIEELRNEKLNELIEFLNFEISTIEKKLRDSDIVEDRIKIINKELEQYKEKEKILKLMVKELSPTEGLIAKSINSFLNVFISEINNIINSIWSYDMTLLPCVVSEGNDLDYKFPVLVNNDETIADVSLGSSSMKEIIDLAFKIVFMKYLGIIGAPLILDEFGKTMDPVHRINAYEAIDKSLSNIFEQIFIISHFESMYGRFANADVSVLSTENLILDKKIEYNKVLKINN